MSKIAVVTDTNSGISPEEAKELGIYLIPMPFTVDGKEYFEGVTCTYEQFFEMLSEGKDVSTSQPSPANITELWDEILKEYDYIVHMPMSSALSSSCATAKALAMDYDGKVVVPDNKRISITLKQAVLDALVLVKKGYSADEICKTLEEKAYNASIYLAVNTLELLKKSGRVTSAGAAIATVLGLKPVLQIQGEKLDAFSKARGMEKAESVMLEALKKDMETRFKDTPVIIKAAYSGDVAPAKEWVQKMKDFFGTDDIELCRLPISIACHVGAGVKALGCIQYEE
ncbi:MAG: DegV family protein [Acutalibacteraceae bacterium]